jgi:hypothetical protein
MGMDVAGGREYRALMDIAPAAARAVKGANRASGSGTAPV